MSKLLSVTLAVAVALLSVVPLTASAENDVEEALTSFCNLDMPPCFGKIISRYCKQNGFHFVFLAAATKISTPYLSATAFC